VLLAGIPDPQSSSGHSQILDVNGGNSTLRPETSSSWTAGLDYSPSWTEGLKASIDYFNIAYTNRLGRITNFFTALTDPKNAPFVTRSPSASSQQAIIDGANNGFFNLTGGGYDPASVAAIVNSTEINIASQHIDGADLMVDYKGSSAIGTTEVFFNGAYLSIRQKVTPLSTESKEAGSAFSPPRFRARGGTTWTTGAWSLTGVINYLGSETNTYQATLPHVASWTTVDLQVAFVPTDSAAFRGTRAAISARNVFDRDPPYLVYDAFVPGIHYDSLNATPLGRFVSVQLSKSW
jgi:outer membrane cobalamin receptor